MKTKFAGRRIGGAAIAAGLLALLAPVGAWAVPTLKPPFDAGYSLVDLAAVPGVPSNYGGVTFKDDDPDTLLITGAAASGVSKIYTIGVVRDAAHHVTGFTGTAAVFANATGPGGGADGGLTFGPGGVLFFTTYSGNRLEQIKPGSTASDKSIDLTALGVPPSVGGVAFVPEGFPGAGHVKLISWSASVVFDAVVTPDGTGTYDLAGPRLSASIGSGPEGMAYVAAGNPQFAAPSVLLSEYSYGRISAYELDAAGDFASTTRRDFITGLSGNEGATIDPLTGDFVLATSNQVIVVHGFDGPTKPLDHFMCYSAKTMAKTPKLAVPTVSLADLFQSGNASADKATALCTSASANGGAISEPAARAKGYQITPAFPYTAHTHIAVTDELNPSGIQLDTVKPDRLLVPAATDGGSFPAPPNASSGPGSYECYKAKVTAKTPKFPKGVQATVSDAFTTPAKVLDVKKPTRLCVPVDANGAGINDADAYLTCYQAKPAKGQPKHVPVKGVYVSDPLGNEQLDTVKELELCVPSQVVFP
jgi:hypothetical protein